MDDRPIWQQSDAQHEPHGTPIRSWLRRHEAPGLVLWTTVLAALSLWQWSSGDHIAACFLLGLSAIPFLRLALR